MSACRCGHEDREHLAWTAACRVTIPEPDAEPPALRWRYCPCPRFDDAALPSNGERPIFGVHHLASKDADWTTPSDSERNARFREWAKGAPEVDA